MPDFKNFGVAVDMDVRLLQYKETTKRTKDRIKRRGRINKGWANLRPCSYESPLKTFSIDWHSLNDLDDFEMDLTKRMRRWDLSPGNYTLQGHTAEIKRRRVKQSIIKKKTAVARWFIRICKFDWDGNNLELTHGKGKMKYAIFRLFRDDD